VHTYNVSLKGFNFTCYQRGKEPLPAVVKPADLIRQATPRVKEFVDETEIEVEGSKPRIERRRRRVRVAAQTVGSTQIRSVLQVEAHSPRDAEGKFMEVCGVRPINGDARFTVVEVTGPASAAIPVEPTTRRKEVYSAAEAKPFSDPAIKAPEV
jgi:hypothetical protein